MSKTYNRRGNIKKGGYSFEKKRSKKHIIIETNMFF